MNYRTIDDMFERGTLVELTDLWTPALARYGIGPPWSSISKCLAIRVRSAGKKTAHLSVRNTTVFTPSR